MYSLIVTERSSTLSKILCNFILARNMGGGPRTFPGGVSKWKWKRMHEKRARDKERRLLDQEKQLYQARIRSHIRAKLAAKPDTSSATHSPMAPEDHIKALANRFMKEGAEDLWNRNDGPLKPPPPRLREFPGSSRRRGSIASPVDLRKLVLEGRRIFSDRQNDNLMNTSSNYTPTRNYSTQSRRKFQKKESSSDEEDSTFGLEGNPARSIARNSFSGQKTLINANAGEFINEKKNIPKRPRKLWRDDSSSGESESDMDSDGLGIVRGGNKIGSSASLGKYDVKTRRRMPPKSYDEESDLSEQVELIRYELNKRKMAEYEQHKSEEDALLGQKRFDECGISPLTIKALSSAGYIRMTRVQEASLSVCLEGKDALVKAKTGTGKSAAFLFLRQ